VILSPHGNSLKGVIIIEIRADQLRQLREIASSFDNFYCVECAQALKDYLINQKIPGKRIKLYTGAGEDDRNNFIYDDNIPVEVISENGRHEGITIVINGEEMVFDNHHHDGLSRDVWMANLQFFGKIHLRQEFQVTEEAF
jgi:hypothetical protein